MILNNRKDTYDIKLSRRRLHGAGRCAARAGPEAGGGEQSTGGEGLSSGSGEQVAERLDRPARSADRAAAGPRRGHGDTERRHARDHRHAQRRVRHGLQEAKLGVFSKTFRRITNRGLRAPSPGYRIKLQAASKPQARTKLQAASDELQATSHKQQAPGSRPLDKVSGTVDRGSLLRYTCL